VAFRLALLALAIAFGAIYAPDLGHGFIRDDFEWIEGSRIASFGDLVRIFTHQAGFYRPLVALTFSADQAIWHLNPLGYAISNLVLFVGAAALLFRLARRFGLPAGAALAAVGVWALDVHAPRMALLWISGRTALMLCVFALAAAEASLRGRHRLAALWCFLALLSKEEAVLLPAILTASAWFDRDEKARALAILKATSGAWVALAVYAALRINSGAFGPSNLPAHYPVVSGASELMRNAGEYAVRAGLIASIASLVVMLAVRPSLPLQRQERRAIVFGALWIAGFFAITIVAAHRSDLYALTPSIGCALIAAALASCALRSQPSRFRLACTALIVAVFALIPTYWLRDGRWVEPADVSAHVMQVLRSETGAATRGHLVLVDDVSMRYGLESAFGTLLPEAVRLLKGNDWTADLTRSDGTCAAPANDTTAMVFAFRAGRLSRCQ
jgi:hypothetical protein